MIYITGDTHGLNDVRKLDSFFHREKDLRQVTKKDYLIILGDVALYWDGGKHDKDVRDYLNSLPCTVLWIDGNHENFDLIDSLEASTMFGGIVNNDDGIIHLKRGEVYTIDGKKFFAFGGGLSIDKYMRIEGKSWWSHEMPSEHEYKNGYNNLAKNNWEVDYVITHTAPSFIAHRLVYGNIMPGEEALQDYFRDITTKLKYKQWFFGHWHMDTMLENKEFVAMYNLVERIE